MAETDFTLPVVRTIVPGALVIHFVRNYIAKGFALWRA